MELNEYQALAMTTCLPTCENQSYMLLNLMGEVGELSSKIGKAIRKGQIAIQENSIVYNFATNEECEEFLNGIKLELGDVFWQLNGLTNMFGFSANDVCLSNLDKLASRKQRNVIDGNGDYR